MDPTTRHREPQQKTHPESLLPCLRFMSHPGVSAPPQPLYSYTASATNPHQKPPAHFHLEAHHSPKVVAALSFGGACTVHPPCVVHPPNTVDVRNKLAGRFRQERARARDTHTQRIMIANQVAQLRTPTKEELIDAADKSYTAVKASLDTLDDLQFFQKENVVVFSSQLYRSFDNILISINNPERRGDSWNAFVAIALHAEPTPTASELKVRRLLS